MWNSNFVTMYKMFSSSKSVLSMCVFLPSLCCVVVEYVLHVLSNFIYVEKSKNIPLQVACY